ncbi:MAG TPA: hypothetical protein VI248_17270 [Kineosporiaceae bacterium]
MAPRPDLPEPCTAAVHGALARDPTGSDPLTGGTGSDPLTGGADLRPGAASPVADDAAPGRAAVAARIENEPDVGLVASGGAEDGAPGPCTPEAGAAAAAGGTGGAAEDGVADRGAAEADVVRRRVARGRRPRTPDEGVAAGRASPCLSASTFASFRGTLPPGQ